MKKYFIYLLFIIISACSPSDRHHELVRGNLNTYLENNTKPANYKNITNPNSDGCWFDDSTQKFTNCIHPDEITYIKNLNGDIWPPKLGLALSGGGTRAASFSIGVLKALHETGQLENVDIISSVSGGSYASYWFYSQLFYQQQLKDVLVHDNVKMHLNFSRDDMFRRWNDPNQTNLEDPNKYRFQRTLEESSDIFSYAHKPSLASNIGIGIQYTSEFILQFISIPIHWIADGLFDWELNIAPFFYFYKHGLERTYGYVPLDYSLESFANSAPFVFDFNKNIQAEPILLNEMTTFLNEEHDQKIPSFIINATAKYGAEYGDYAKVGGRSMENSIFEFTPWSCYSTLLYEKQPKHGHKTTTPYCPEDFRINSPTSLLSESRDLDLARIIAISGAAVDGQIQFVDIGGEVEDQSTLTGKTGLDIVLDITNLNWGYHVTNPNSNGWNNFAHKLIPWPFYLLHDSMSQESPTSIYLTDGGFSDNLGLFPLIRRGVKNIIVVDAEQDGQSFFESAKRINKTLNKYDLELQFKQRKPISVQDTVIQDAVIFGTISGENLAEDIKITYIKLAVPSQINQGNTKHNNHPLPFSVKSYMKNNPGFPHQSTADVFYSIEQFRAYRDLGYFITLTCFEKKKGKYKGFDKPL